MKKNGKVFERWHYIILRITSKNLLVKFLNPGATQTSFTVKKVSIFFPQVTSYKKTHFNNFPVFLFFLLLKRKTQNKHFTQFQIINNIFLAKFQKNLSKRNFIFFWLYCEHLQRKTRILYFCWNSVFQKGKKINILICLMADETWEFLVIFAEICVKFINLCYFRGTVCNLFLNMANMCHSCISIFDGAPWCKNRF